MNETQILLAIENLMKSVIEEDYSRQDLEDDLAALMDDARDIYNSYREYAPLIQAYFDLLPERISRRDKEIFYRDTAFYKFQSRLTEAQEKYIQDFNRNNRRNKRNLKKYFATLVERHRKLLLVRVDLNYSSSIDTSVRQFSDDLEKMISRIQNKDTIFKDQVGYVYRLEQGGKSRGYHCHLLVIYNGTRRCSDSYLGMEIGKLWRDKITEGDGEFYNCNQADHKRRYKREGRLGIGMINRARKSEVDKAHEVISYLARPEKDTQYLRGKLPGMRQFRKGELPTSNVKN